MPSTLPSDFADLEPFAEWAIPTERARYDKRLASTMDEMQAFYDAAMPRMEDALAYLEQFSMDALPDDAKRLLWLSSSLVRVSSEVGVWRRPSAPDGGAWEFTAVVAPGVGESPTPSTSPAGSRRDRALVVAVDLSTLHH